MPRKKKNTGAANGVLEMDAPQAEPVEVEPTEATLNDAADSIAADLLANSEAADEPPTEVPIPGPVERPKPPKPPKPAEPEVDPLWAKLTERQKEADALHDEYLELAEEAKQKKKSWEAKVEEVATLIRQSAKPMPLFDKKPAPEPFEAAPPEHEDEPEIDGAATILQIAPGTEAVDKDGWKTTPIAELVQFGMPKKYVKILAEADVATIADIAALGDKRLDLSDLKDIGQSARDKIYDALDSFWAAHPEYGDQPAAPEDDPEEWGPNTVVELTEDGEEAAEKWDEDKAPDEDSYLADDEDEAEEIEPEDDEESDDEPLI